MLSGAGQDDVGKLFPTWFSDSSLSTVHMYSLIVTLSLIGYIVITVDYLLIAHFVEE